MTWLTHFFPRYEFWLVFMLCVEVAICLLWCWFKLKTLLSSVVFVTYIYYFYICFVRQHRYNQAKLNISDRAAKVGAAFMFHVALFFFFVIHCCLHWSNCIISSGHGRSKDFGARLRIGLFNRSWRQAAGIHCSARKYCVTNNAHFSNKVCTTGHAVLL